jgi:hypothetical protein
MELKMKIMFDSNVWQKVISPENYKEESDCFEIINNSIVDKKITPYLSETIFTLESIRGKERREFFGDVEPKITIEKRACNGIVNVAITMSSNPDNFVNFNDNSILKSYFEKAIKLDFKIVGFPRLGKIKNTDLENHIIKVDGKITSYMCEIETEIFNRNSGYYFVENLVRNCDGNNISKKIKQLPKSDCSKVKKAVAEWADGDSVACCIALDCDYFCTRDLAKGAGGKSVLSKENLKWLNKKYGFKTISPEELSEICKTN